MSFEDQVRKEIAATPFSDKVRRSVLKVVLGEVQLATARGKFTDEQGHAIVKKMIVANKENLTYLDQADSRYDGYKEENDILAGLLPSYWALGEISCSLAEAGLVDQIKAAKNDGQAMGLAMRHLKSLNAPVEGDMVKAIVEGFRK